MSIQVDVTNLLSDEGGNNVTTTDEKEDPTKSSSSSSSDDLTNAANEIQIDLNNLAEIIQAASQISTTDEIQKKVSIDEEDDTSRQATQDYDLHEVRRRKKRLFHIIYLKNIYSNSIVTEY